MLPLVAGGMSLLGSAMANKEAEEEARKRTLQGLSDAYAQGEYAQPSAPAEGADPMQALAGAGLATMDQGKANDALAKRGEETDFGDDFATGLRTLYRR